LKCFCSSARRSATFLVLAGLRPPWHCLPGASEFPLIPHVLSSRTGDLAHKGPVVTLRTNFKGITLSQFYLSNLLPSLFAPNPRVAMSRPIIIRTVEIIYPSGKCPCHPPETPQIDQSIRLAEFVTETRTMALAGARHGVVECVDPPEPSPEMSPPPSWAPSRHPSESPTVASSSSRRRPWDWVLRRESQ